MRWIWITTTGLLLTASLLAAAAVRPAGECASRPAFGDRLRV